MQAAIATSVLPGGTGGIARAAARQPLTQADLLRFAPETILTIAGTLPEIFAHMTPANDLRFRRGTDSPTVRVEGLTVAGA